jgi:hypothetical protein
MKISFADIPIFGWLLARDSASLVLHHSLTSLTTSSGSQMMTIHGGYSKTYFDIYLNTRHYISQNNKSPAMDASKLTSWEVTFLNVIQNVGKVSCTVQGDRKVLTHLAYPKNFTVCSGTFSGKSLRFFYLYRKIIHKTEVGSVPR